MKPGFFQNEDLIELPFEYRLLFAGIWTMADREGRLEDRHKKIKLTVFPGDSVDCNAGLQALHDKGFIIRYESGGNRFIQVKNWSKHQSPHIKEAASTIPAYEAPSASTVPAPDRHCASTSVAALTPSSLTPDSGLLTADSSSLRSQDPSAAAPPARRVVARRTLAEDPEWLLDFKLAYPKRNGDQPWRKAIRAANARLAEGHTAAEFLAGARRYAEHCEASGKLNTEYVQQACRFLGPDKPFLLPWHAPPKPESAMDRILRANSPDNSRVIDHDPELRALTG